MVLIDKETIRKKIEQMEEMDYPCDNSEQEVGFHFALFMISAFLDTLEAEQSDNEEKFRNLLDAMGDCGFSQDDIFLLKSIWEDMGYSIPKQEQPTIDHNEIEVKFRGEWMTVSCEFCRDGKRNYSTSEQDDNVIWAALRVWCEKRGITAFELYPKQSEQPVEGLEEEYKKWWESITGKINIEHTMEWYIHETARHFAEWRAAHLKR